MMEILHQLALKEIDGIGGVLFRQLLSYFGSAEAVFAAPKSRLLKVPGMGKQLVESFKSKELYLEEAQKHLDLCVKNKVDILPITHVNYPKRLKSLYDAPAVLYFKGNMDLNHSKTIGIVGTRKATSYGKDMTKEIVEGLKNNGVAVISGLAYGIDIAAHKAALQVGLPTVAVMAGGLGSIYPAAHKKYALELQENGGLLSESSYKTLPVAAQFVARNRIIAGLSDVILLVESAKRGGGLITVEYANNYHKEVFAVPGNVGMPFSEGPNHLISQNKAAIFTSVDDLIDAMQWNKVTDEVQKKPLDLSNFSDEESKVLSLLHETGAMQIDDLSFQTQVSLNKLAGILLNLEIQDLVRALPGKKFELKRGL